MIKKWKQFYWFNFVWMPKSFTSFFKFHFLCKSRAEIHTVATHHNDDGNVHAFMSRKKARESTNNTIKLMYTA